MFRISCEDAVHVDSGANFSECASFPGEYAAGNDFDTAYSARHECMVFASPAADASKDIWRSWDDDGAATGLSALTRVAGWQSKLGVLRPTCRVRLPDAAAWLRARAHVRRRVRAIRGGRPY